MVNNTRNVSTFWDELMFEFDTGWLTPQINFALYIVALLLGILGFIIIALR